MNINQVHYEFSEESHHLLKKFLNTVESVENKPVSDPRWKKILSKNEDLIKMLNEVVDISSESSQNISVENTPMDVSNNPEEHSDANFNISDIVSAISDQAINNDVANEVFDILSSRSDEEINSFFIELGNKIKAELIDEFGKFLILYKGAKQNILITYFLRHLLIKKFIDGSYYSSNTFSNYIIQYPFILCMEIAKTVALINFDNCPKEFLEQLKDLKPENKQEILREFVLHCTKLEEKHFAVIDILMVTQMDLGILKKIIEMFATSCNEFSKDKSFGKLLHDVLQKMEASVFKFEKDIRNIVLSHKSPWKVKIKKLFECNLAQNTSFSQIY